jgi:RNA polymerase sigma factor (sigma-70 family)
MEAATARWTRRHRPERRDEDRIEVLVQAARTGDAEAWDELVRRFEGMLRAVVARQRLSSADSADVKQTTWLRLAENIGRLQDPSRVGGWLATTARRECARIRRSRARELPHEELPEPSNRDVASIEGRLFVRHRNRELRAAFARLPARDRILLGLLVAEPQPSYESISAALGMPIGSIGPTRGRALERLRRELERSDRPDDLAA